MKCKICDKNVFMDFQKHCVQLAKYESWQKALGNPNETPHFDYYLANTTKDTKIVGYFGRTWKK